MLKPTTRRLLNAVAARRECPGSCLRKSKYMQGLADRGNKLAAKYSRKTKKARKELAAKLREMRAENDHHLVVLWHSA